MCVGVIQETEREIDRQKESETKRKGDKKTQINSKIERDGELGR